MKGDTEDQAALRFEANETWEQRFEGSDPNPRFYELVLAHAPATLLDCGCGTGHVLSHLHDPARRSVGLDASPFMINHARRAHVAPRLHWIVADEAALPLRSESQEGLISRLADYTPDEVARVLAPDGRFFEYGLGPADSAEIAEAFGARYLCEYERDAEAWYAARDAVLQRAGLETEHIEIVRGTDVLTEKQLVDSILMVPLVSDFDPQRDRAAIEAMGRGGEYRVSREITLRVARKRR